MSINVNEFNFQSEVLDSKTPMLVDFGAEWCHPCKMLDPILDKLEVQWKEQIHVARVDVDECGNLAMQMQVMSVPTMILFVDGGEVSRLVGLQSPDRIAEKFGSLIGTTLS